MSNLSEAIETDSERAIQHGLNIREDFWDDLIMLCNDREGLAELLNVPADKITSWPLKIKENLERVNKSNDHDTDKTKLMDTGKLF